MTTKFPERYFPERYFSGNYYTNLIGEGPIVLASQYFFKKNTSIHLSKVGVGSADATNTVKLNVKDFSFNRQSNSSLIARQTINPTQPRGVKVSTEQLNPLDITFSTYVNPLLDTTVTSPEENLWIGLLGADLLTSNASTSTVDFSNGNVGELNNLTAWFQDPTHLDTVAQYRIDNIVIDRATINFGLDQITTIEWGGRALGLVSDFTAPTATDRTNLSNYIKNKLSTITMNVNSVDYNLILSGGQITISNNNTFYGRQKLGEIRAPVGHYTGNRTITGTLEFYLKTGVDNSADLFETLHNNITLDTYEQDYVANIQINLGGSTNNPNLQINIPQAVFDLPNQSFDDVIKMSLPFTAEESSGNYVSVIYNL